MPRRPSVRLLPAVLTMLAAAVLAGCTRAAPSASATLTPSPAPGSSSEPVPDPLRGLAVVTVSLDGRPLRVAVANTNGARQRGLMGVADLGPLGGLLFSYPAAVETSFHMRDVPIPLDIAFFDADGRLVTVLEMAVCEVEPCPSYRSPAPFRWALEAPAGDLAGLGLDARLSLAP